MDGVDPVAAVNGDVRGNPEVIQALKVALEEAKAGRIAGVAIVKAVGPEQLSLGSAGLCPATLAAGCAQMQAMILSGMFAPKRSAILRPGMRM